MGMQHPHIVEYYDGIVDAYNRMEMSRHNQRQEMIEIVASGAQRRKISWDIRESLERKKKRKIHKNELGGELQGGRIDT